MKTLLCDTRAAECSAEVLEVCKVWGMAPPTDSMTYHQRTNGAAGCGSAEIELAVAAWQQRHMTSEW